MDKENETCDSCFSTIQANSYKNLIMLRSIIKLKQRLLTKGLDPLENSILSDLMAAWAYRGDGVFYSPTEELCQMCGELLDNCTCIMQEDL